MFFTIGDSTRFPELAYGLRAEIDVEQGATLVVTPRDLFSAPNGEVRTPWYRISLSGRRERPMTIRFVVGDDIGAETVAHYELTVEKDRFYQLYTAINTRQPPDPQRPSVLDGVEFFPVHPGAQRQLSDSLFVGYKSRGRKCFNCLF